MTGDARARVEREAQARAVAYAEHELERAAELLAALEAVGEAHGVPASVWPAVTSLPAAALDAVRMVRRHVRSRS